MRALRFLILFVFVGLLAPVAAHAASPEEQVKAAYAAWNAAFNKGDAKAVAAFYAEDALLLPADHQVIKGRAGVETYFAGLIANGLTGHELELIQVDPGSDMVVGAAKWSVKGKDANGAAATFGGVTTHVFAKAPDGSLQLALHTFN
jgi:uncharacterized protein (TIGR02246 family)